MSTRSDYGERPPSTDPYLKAVAQHVFIQCEDGRHTDCDGGVVFMDRPLAVCLCRCHG